MKKSFALVSGSIFLFQIFPATAGVKPAQDLGHLLNRAADTTSIVQSQNLQHYSFAQDLPGLIAQKDPTDPEQLVLRGQEKEKAKDITGALADYNRAIELDPKAAYAYDARGTLKSNSNDIKGAMADYNQAIELDPTKGLYYVSRAFLKFFKLQDTPGARSDLDRSIAVDPKAPLAYYMRGLLKNNVLKDRAGATEDFQQARLVYQQQDVKNEPLAGQIDAELKKLGINNSTPTTTVAKVPDAPADDFSGLNLSIAGRRSGDAMNCDIILEGELLPDKYNTWLISKGLVNKSPNSRLLSFSEKVTTRDRSGKPALILGCSIAEGSVIKEPAWGGSYDYIDTSYRINSLLKDSPFMNLTLCVRDEKDRIGQQNWIAYDDRNNSQRCVSTRTDLVDIVRDPDMVISRYNPMTGQWESTVKNGGSRDVTKTTTYTRAVLRLSQLTGKRFFFPISRGL